MAQRLHSNVELLELTRSIRVSVGGNETGALRETMLADLVLAPKVVLEDTSPADGSMQELPTLQLIHAFCRGDAGLVVSVGCRVL